MVLVKALYDCEGDSACELSFPKGAIIEKVVKEGTPPGYQTEMTDGWWFGTYNGVEGIFPADYVEETVDAEAEDALECLGEFNKPLPKGPKGATMEQLNTLAAWLAEVCPKCSAGPPVKPCADHKPGANAAEVTAPPGYNLEIADGKVKGGDPLSLVVMVTDPKASDQLANTFFLTFRHYATAMEVFELLQENFDNARPKASQSEEEVEKWRSQVRVKTMSVVRLWIERFWLLDFELNQKLQTAVLDWVKAKSDEVPEVAMECKLVLNIANAFGKAASMRITPKEPKVGTPSNLSIDKLDPVKVAKEITRIDMQLFKAIQPSDFVVNLWSKEAAPEGVERVEDFIEHFNKMSWWTATKICLVKDVKERGKLATKLIVIAQELFKLHNFNSSMAIICGMSTSPVLRLKKTWALVPAKMMKIKADLELQFSGERNYMSYRELEAKSERPIIPFFGLYIQDFTFMNDGNPKKLPSGLINWEKLEQISELVLQCMDLQKNAYIFQRDDAIYSWITNLTPESEKVLYEHSLRNEPRDK